MNARAALRFGTQIAPPAPAVADPRSGMSDDPCLKYRRPEDEWASKVFAEALEKFPHSLDDLSLVMRRPKAALQGILDGRYRLLIGDVVALPPDMRRYVVDRFAQYIGMRVYEKKARR